MWSNFYFNFIPTNVKKSDYKGKQENIKCCYSKFDQYYELKLCPRSNNKLPWTKLHLLNAR